MIPSDVSIDRGAPAIHSPRSDDSFSSLGSSDDERWGPDDDAANEVVDADTGRVVGVADLTFMRTLGSGSYGRVKLAMRKKRMMHKLRKSLQDLSGSIIGQLSPIANATSPLSGHHTDNMEGSRRSFRSGRSGRSGRSRGGDDDQELYAVKIFSKSILKRMRTMTRDGPGRRLRVSTALDKVYAEVALMKKLHHPNIVELHDVYDSEEMDAMYMVLEYVTGGEIMSYDEETRCYYRKQRTDGNCITSDATHQPERAAGDIEGSMVMDGPYDEASAALYFVDILQGLAYLHSNFICHRDLKPENILIDAHTKICKITDFGVSHFFEAEARAITPTASPTSSPERERERDRLPAEHNDETRSTGKHEDAMSMASMGHLGRLSKTEGTYCFWSPEMCDGRDSFSGYAADMWAAGICLYIFVTGRVPFHDDNPATLFEKIAEGKVLLFDTMSPDLKSMLRMLLQRDHEKRAGVGDCLKHPFLKKAVKKRREDLSKELSECDRQPIKVSDAEKQAAITHFSKAVIVMRAADKLQKKLVTARKIIRERSRSIRDRSKSRDRGETLERERSKSTLERERSKSTPKSFHDKERSRSRSHPRGRSFGRLDSGALSTKSGQSLKSNGASVRSVRSRDSLRDDPRLASPKVLKDTERPRSVGRLDGKTYKVVTRWDSSVSQVPPRSKEHAGTPDDKAGGLARPRSTGKRREAYLRERSASSKSLTNCGVIDATVVRTQSRTSSAKSAKKTVSMRETKRAVVPMRTPRSKALLAKQESKLTTTSTSDESCVLQ
eukprot:CAMPEP_0194294310 /NCGR_PEP_ID=MMETSP0169-20130528/50243_1 /TAXON_ID=218684 /ORGANISM="Corethron pennatum, Strain L29A3" /LENGTH=780 /DNA_ID=CAMNT_0039043111 /DNA_START=130 /DNA_END=2472 /DNA_ORIENTATION=+